MSTFSIKIKEDGTVEENNYLPVCNMWLMSDSFELLPISIDEVQVMDLVQRKIVHKSALISLKGEKLEYIATPFACSEDIYYCVLSGGSIFISNDFYECCRRLPRLSVSENNMDIFYSTNTTPAGKTFFNEIKRILPDGVWKWQGSAFFDLRAQGGFRMRPFSTGEDDYLWFKRLLDTTLLQEIGSLSSVGLMYSGGVDSTLLGQIITKKFGKKISCCTVLSVPTNVDFESDNTRIDFALEHLPWSLKRVVVDFNKVDLSKLKEFAKLQPLAPHVSFGFFEMANFFQNSGIHKVFCGQNLDTLYSLGATSRIGLSQSALAALFRRFFFSEFFLSGVAKATGEITLGSSISKLVGQFGALIYSRQKNIDYLLPQSSAELIENYKLSPDEVVFSKFRNGVSPMPIANSGETAYDIFQSLLKHKITEYLMGGINMTPHNSFNNAGCDAILPYSSNIMSHFFLRNQLGIKDILWPKKFVYRYSRELGPNLYTRRLRLAKKAGDRKKLLDPQSWYAELLRNTSFGRGLMADQEAAPEGFKTSTEAQKFNWFLCDFWRKAVFQEVAQRTEIMG